MIEEIQNPSQVRERINEGKPVLLGIMADWCPDCRDLKEHFEKHARRAEAAGVSVLRISVQEHRRVYRSDEHEELTKGLATEKPVFPFVALYDNGKLVSATAEENTGKGYKVWLKYSLSRLKRKESAGKRFRAWFNHALSKLKR